MSDTLIQFGGSVKALEGGKVEGYLIIFSDETAPDISHYKDYFSPETDFDIETGAKSAVYYEHGLDPVLKRRKLGTGTLEIKSAGVWIEAQLNLRDEYEKAVYELAQKGKLGWSSGTAPHLTEREKKSNGTHHIKHWPLGLDASLTPNPAEPRTAAITSLKSYREEILAPATKGLLKDKLEARTPSWWQIEDGFRDVVRDIANAARSSKVTGVAVDVTALAKDALGEFTELLLPLIVAQVADFVDNPTDEHFYLKTKADPFSDTPLAFVEYALSQETKSGRRNSARDLELLNRILRAAKELGAGDEPEETQSDAVKSALDRARLDLASLELSAL